jgi:hypothetical protein
MFKWLTNIFKEVPEPVVVAVTIPEEVKTTDFPFAEYYAYWEIIPLETPSGEKAELRFLGYGNSLILETVIVSGDIIREKLNSIIKNQMIKYKRV